ncbi:MAG: hypothetical protein ACKVUS_05965 [Saprospiraceae bacterium]
MNLYFLVEGLTEFKVYPIWIEYLSSSKLARCNSYLDVSTNHYYVFNCEGAGKMVHRSIADAINEIVAHPVFDFFVIVIDAEDNAVSERMQRVQTAIREASVQLPPNCQVEILIQRVCFETWLCGHTDHFLTAKSSTNKSVREFMEDYDMGNLDPEAMPINPRNRTNCTHLTIGKYHSTYLHWMLHPRYSKRNADLIIDTQYLNRLVQRKNKTPSHLDTFGQMLAFLQRVNLAV